MKKACLKITKFILLIWSVMFADLLAEEAVVPDWVKGQTVSVISWPDAFRGNVTDLLGKPISGADISLSIDAQIWTLGGIYEKELYRATTTSATDGRYTLATDGVPQYSHRPLSINVTASAKNHVAWRTWWWYGMDDTIAEPNFSTLKLKTGRQLSGKCVGPNGTPIPGAVLNGFYSGSVRGAWGDTAFKCDEKGRFCLLAPNDGLIGFWVYASESGPNFFKVTDGEKANLEFRLDQGAKVLGLVRSRDGSPIGNAVVEAVSANTGNLPGYSLPFRIAARSDSQGKFRLPPISGEYLFYLTSASQYMMGGGSYESPTRVPLSLPVKRTMNDGNRQSLVLRESETAVIFGKVKWKNNEPAAGSIVRVSQMPEGNGSGFSLGRTVADKNGSYRIHIPIPIKRLTVYVESRRRFGQNVRAFVEDSEENEHPRLEQVTGDTSVNFVFEPPKEK